MVEAIICDQRRMFTACAYLDGEYSYDNIYLGVPVIIGKNGVERVIELEFDSDNIKNLEASQKKVKDTLESLNIL